MKMYVNLVLGNEKRLQTTAGSSTTQLEESRTGVAEDLPVSAPCQMPCSSTASSSTQATSMAPQPSHSCEVLLSAKECEDLISQFFGTNKVVHSYYTCPSKLCSSLKHEEIARLKQQDLPVSAPCQMPCSSTASSSTQATSMAPQPSHSCEVLLSAKECEDLISQFFGTNKVVHSYYTCPSKLFSSLKHEEIARLKQQKKKYIHTWHQEKENWWLCFVQGEGMFCLLCKKHAIKTVQNKEETAFTQTASMRLKYDALKVHRDSDQHHKAVSQELLQRIIITLPCTLQL